MSKASIDLICMPYQVMLLVEHPSGVVYRHQVGSFLCKQVELEGVLAAVDFSDSDEQQIMKLPYGSRNITPEIADAIDAILAANPRARYLTVDRMRLRESYEAWVFVRADTKPDTPDHTVPDGYFGSAFDFGMARGVLIWPNSD